MLRSPLSLRNNQTRLGNLKRSWLLHQTSLAKILCCDRSGGSLGTLVIGIDVGMTLVQFSPVEVLFPPVNTLATLLLFFQ